MIDTDDLPSSILDEGKKEELVITLPVTMEEVEKKVIYSTIDYFEGNKSKAADELKIGRKTLYRKLEEFEKDNA